MLMYWNNNIIIPTATRSFHWKNTKSMKWNATSCCDRWNGIDPWRTEISLDRVVPWEDWEFLPVCWCSEVFRAPKRWAETHAFPLSSWQLVFGYSTVPVKNHRWKKASKKKTLQQWKLKDLKACLLALPMPETIMVFYTVHVGLCR